MNARELFVVLLRVLGLFFLAWAIEAMPLLVGTAVQYQQVFSIAGQAAHYYWVWAIATVLVPLLRAVLGILLLVFASRIGFWFYPQTGEETESVKQWSVNAGDVYRIASFLLGAFVLVRAVPAGARTVVMLMGGGHFNQSQFLPDLVTACVLFLFGMAFMFGASGIAQLLERLRYDPENVPPRQFSLRLLFLILVGVALILGLIRYFVS
jgi:cation transporter-like permease